MNVYIKNIPFFPYYISNPDTEGEEIHSPISGGREPYLEIQRNTEAKDKKLNE